MAAKRQKSHNCEWTEKSRCRLGFSRFAAGCAVEWTGSFRMAGHAGDASAWRRPGNAGGCPPGTGAGGPAAMAFWWHGVLFARHDAGAARATPVRPRLDEPDRRIGAWGLCQSMQHVVRCDGRGPAVLAHGGDLCGGRGRPGAGAGPRVLTQSTQRAAQSAIGRRHWQPAAAAMTRRRRPVAVRSRPLRILRSFFLAEAPPRRPGVPKPPTRGRVPRELVHGVLAEAPACTDPAGSGVWVLVVLCDGGPWRACAGRGGVRKGQRRCRRDDADARR